jgi:hypothetical protein
VKEKFPETDVVDLIVSWVRELSATRIFGSRDPNVIGSAEFTDQYLLVFKGLLEGLTTKEIEARAASTPRQAASASSSVEEIATHLKSLPLFKSLFCP